LIPGGLTKVRHISNQPGRKAGLFVLTLRKRGVTLRGDHVT
jgi:hypothetical protein